MSSHPTPAPHPNVGAPLALGLLAVAAVLGAHGCGTSCPLIAEDLQRFDTDLDARPPDGALRSGPPNARLSIPLDALNPHVRRLVADRIGHRVPMPSLPGTSGVPVPLDDLSWTLLDLRLVPHEGGVAAELGLAVLDTEGPLIEATVTARIQPVFLHGASGHVDRARLRLRPRDVARVNPTLPAHAAERLGQWIEGELPRALRIAVDRAALKQLGGALLQPLVELAWPSVRDDVLGDAPLVDVELALPRWPVRSVTVESWPAADGDGGGVHLVLWGEAGATPGAAPLLRVAQPVQAPTLSLHGSLALRLVALAQRERAMPARFSEDGAIDDGGPWHVRTAWRGGSRPFGATLWRFDDACRRVDLDAELGLALEGDALVVGVREARVLAVRGPGFLEAFAWLERLFGDAMDLTLRQPTTLEIGDAEDRWTMHVVAVRFDGEILTSELELRPAPRSTH